MVVVVVVVVTAICVGDDGVLHDVLDDEDCDYIGIDLVVVAPDENPQSRDGCHILPSPSQHSTSSSHGHARFPLPPLPPSCLPHGPFRLTR